MHTPTFASVFLAIAFLLLSDSVQAVPGFDAWTINCAPLTQQQSDPIVSPGLPSSHVHAITGGNAFSRQMNGTDATLATATTCDKTIDHSNYWVPQLYHINSDGKFEMVKFNGNVSFQYQIPFGHVQYH